jgi:hypothetical protein
MSSKVKLDDAVHGVLRGTLKLINQYKKGKISYKEAHMQQRLYNTAYRGIRLASELTGGKLKLKGVDVVITKKK